MCSYMPGIPGGIIIAFIDQNPLANRLASSIMNTQNYDGGKGEGMGTGTTTIPATVPGTGTGNGGTGTGK